MSTPLTPELRAKIISSIKDDGMSIEEAAKTYSFHESTLRKWLRSTVDNAHTSSGELARLRRGNSVLKEIIGSFVLEREATKKISLARETMEKSPYLSMRSIAKYFGIARSTLYLKSKRTEKDKALLAQILAVMEQHPGYGKERITRHL